MTFDMTLNSVMASQYLTMGMNTEDDSGNPIFVNGKLRWPNRPYGHL